VILDIAVASPADSSNSAPCQVDLQVLPEFIARPPAQRLAWLASTLGASEQDALRAIASNFLLEPMGASELERIQPDFALAPFAECDRRQCVLGRWRQCPTKDENDALLFICSDPVDLDAHAWFEAVLERLAPERLVRAIARPEDLRQYLAREEENLRAMDSIEVSARDESKGESGGLLQLSMTNIESTENATVRLVDSTLYDALRFAASDIHFELQHKSLQIKYRLDGVLQPIKRVESLGAAHQAISRIKVLADLDIAERRVPQDGRFRVMLDRREIDFRVSIMPNSSGEDAVLRVLDRKHLTGQFEALTLDSLSFEAETKSFIRRASHLPYGLLLVTGPTGSGKTTTLYAAISEINTGLDKIVTIEDPIEYQLSGVLQIPVNEKKGLTFAKGLRSILRHDPDKIMVGEIRDSETAQIAVQASLTGHQVFTTVHANNVFDVIGRFSNMGVDSYSLVAALTGIMAQRLVRAVCPHCAVRMDPSVDEKRQITAQRRTPEEPLRLMKASGCPECRGTGYRGRVAIAETLPMDDEMRDLLVQHAPISSVKRLARDKGFRDLRQSGLALAARGLTTLDEVNRVAPAE
jgi:general secretion pathway protein E